MEEMLKTIMPMQRALVQVSRRFWSLATPALYRSVIITHPHTLNLLFRSIKMSGERSLLFRHGVRRFHLSIRNRYQWDIFPGTEELMENLPNLKITCNRGWLHPTKPLLFTAIDLATSFHHLEAIEHSFGTHFSIIMVPTINLLRSSPILRVFLVPYDQFSVFKPNLYAFKYLRGCYIDAMIHSSPSDDSIGPNLEDTNKQPLSSQTPFPPLHFLFYFIFIFYIYPIYRAKMYIYVKRTIGCVDSERAVARSVTVLFLLGLWLFAFPALVWGAIGGDFVYNYSR